MAVIPEPHNSTGVIKEKKKWSRNKKIVFFVIIVPLSLFLLVGIASGTYLYVLYKNWERTQKTSILSETRAYYNQLRKVLYPKQYIGKEGNPSEPILLGMGSVIYDSTGEKVLGKFVTNEILHVNIENTSPKFLKALLATEDRNFFHHDGVDYKAILRALVENVKAGDIVQGGSTITQQIARILSKERDVSVTRKINEWFSAWAIEEEIKNKEKLLTMYINLSYFGHGATGIETASRLYFDKPAKDLDWGESALLAGVIANPSKYSPFKHYKLAKSRHYRVLIGMKECGIFKTKEELDGVYRRFWKTHDFKELKNQMITKRKKMRMSDAPYIVEHVRKYWLSKYENDSMLYNKGYKIYTTIDYDIQMAAQDILHNGILDYRKKVSGIKRLSKSLNEIQGALVAMNPENGYVEAFVGGDSFYNTQLDRVHQSIRHPGSAFKPILYLAGLRENKISPYTLMKDVPISLEMEDGKIWSPKNYGNRYFGRELTLVNALKYSSNSIAAQTINMVGEQPIREIIQGTLGITHKEALDRFPIGQKSMALGAVLMSPLELAKIYSMIANEGVSVESFIIKEIRDPYGNIIESYVNNSEPTKHRVVSREAAFEITSMMKAVMEPGGTGGHIKPSNKINFDLAGKTGTSQRYRDLWFAGFTPEMCAVIWIGHDKNKDLTGGGGRVAGPIFGKFIKKVSELRKFTPFVPPSSMKKVYVCRDSGFLAITGKCKHIDKAYLRDNDIPTSECPLSHSGYEDWSVLEDDASSDFMGEASYDDVLGPEYMPPTEKLHDYEEIISETDDFFDILPDSTESKEIIIEPDFSSSKFDDLGLPSIIEDVEKPDASTDITSEDEFDLLIKEQKRREQQNNQHDREYAPQIPKDTGNAPNIMNKKDKEPDTYEFTLDKPASPEKETKGYVEYSKKDEVRILPDGEIVVEDMKDRKKFDKPIKEKKAPEIIDDKSKVDEVEPIDDELIISDEELDEIDRELQVLEKELERKDKKR